MTFDKAVERPSNRSRIIVVTTALRMYATAFHTKTQKELELVTTFGTTGVVEAL